MPSREVREQQLGVQAEQLAQALPLSERTQFKKDFVECYIELNDRVEARIAAHEADLAELLVQVDASVPVSVTKILEQHEQFLWNVCKTMMGYMEQVYSTAIRDILLETAIDCAKMCGDTCAKLRAKSDDRKKAVTS